MSHWIALDKPECPVEDDVLVAIKTRRGEVLNKQEAGNLIWTDNGWGGDIIAWRPSCEKCKDNLEALLVMRDALERSILDIEPCKVCGENVVGVPGGLVMCEYCEVEL